MLIEDYKRIDGWLNIRIDPLGNQSLYDFSKYMEGIHHTLSEAQELYNKYINNQPERLNPEAFKKEGVQQNINPDYVRQVCEINENLIERCDSLNSENK